MVTEDGKQQMENGKWKTNNKQEITTEK